MLTPQAAVQRRLAEADLLSGAEALARYRHHGPPKVVSATKDDAATVLRDICDQVEPGDLSGGFAELWRSGVVLWHEGLKASLEDALFACDAREKDSASVALAWTRAHGLGIGFMAPYAARRILRLRQAMEEHTEAVKVLTRAQEQAQDALRGV